MKFSKSKFLSRNLFRIILSGLLVTTFFCGQSVLAVTDYIFFSVNGDTTLSVMTQGDEFAWGSNCNTGATINWEIWYDINSNSTIDRSSDFLLATKNIIDGSPLSEAVPILDGWVISEVFNLGLEPGDYIFKATDIATEVTVQKIMTMMAMSSPPNQITGQITLPGYPAPNSFLANRLVSAESETGDEGTFLAATDINGFYSINIAATGLALKKIGIDTRAAPLAPVFRNFRRDILLIIFLQRLINDLYI